MASAQKDQDMAVSAPAAPDVARAAAMTSSELSSEGQSKNWFAQIVGILVFVLGVAIILYVLRLGFEMYNDPAASLRAFQTVGSKNADIGMAFAGLVLRIALLFFGSISGSLIANKGINLYFTALRRD